MLNLNPLAFVQVEQFCGRMYFAEVPMWLVFVVVFLIWYGWKVFQQIPVNKAKELLKDGAILLDVRSESEYSGGNLPGSINLPLQRLDADLESIVSDKEAIILCHCLSGTRSGVAVSKLKARGYSAYNLGSFSRASKIAGS